MGAGRRFHMSDEKQDPSMPPITIYTKAFCPYCTRAKRLLDGKGAA